MFLNHRLVGAGCVCLLISVATSALGQSYPSRPIRIVTAEVGGSSDFIARLMAQGMGPALGQPIIVQNRGGSAMIPIETVAKAAADGYTLLVFTSNLWISPLLQTASYDAVKDFAPVTMISRAPSVLVVTLSLPAGSAKELIALAKARPGQMNYASGPSGAASHIAGALFKAMAGIDIVNVTYKGAAPALVDVMSGQAQMMFPNGASVAPQLKSGKLKALAVTTAQPSILFPSLPTVAATGLPGYESVVINGMFAPARTAEAIVRHLNQESVRFLQAPEMKDRLIIGGTEPVASTPQEFSTVIKAEIARLGKVFKEAGIRAE